MIRLLSSGLIKHTSTVFLVYFPHSNFCFVSSFKNKTSPVQHALHDVLCDVFECDSISQINVQGKDLGALKDMALHPLAQGKFGAYRLYEALLDQKVLGTEDGDDRRLQRELDKVENRRDVFQSMGGDGAGGSPAKAVRFARAPGLGVVVNANEDFAALAGASSSGVLNKQQRAQRTKGTNGLNAVKLVVEHDLEWNGKSIPFACSVVVKGKNIMKGVEQLGGLGLVDSNVNLPHALGDASNVIRDAFQATESAVMLGLTGKRNWGLDDAQDDAAAAAASRPKKLVRTIELRCL